MASTTVFKNNQIRPLKDKFSCGQYETFSDDYFECYLKHWSHTVYHPAGTCKMGPKKDPMAVVDSELKLHGIQNLRVIDASIMPAITGCNTNAPTIMIGEKGADMIIKTWKLDKAYHSKKDTKQKTEL